MTRLRRLAGCAGGRCRGAPLAARRDRAGVARRWHRRGGACCPSRCSRRRARTCSRRATARCSARASRATGNGGSRPRTRCRRSSGARCWRTRTSGSSSTSAWTRSRSRARCGSTLGAGRVVSGGSTLTMQLGAAVARRRARRRTQLRDKLVELLLALRLERALQQGRAAGAVLRRNAPFGGNVVGPRGRVVALFRPRPGRRCPGRRPRRSRCCPTIRRWCTSRAIASGCRRSATQLLRRLQADGDSDRDRSRPGADRAAGRRAARPARSRAAPARDPARRRIPRGTGCAPRSMRGCRRRASRR